MKRSISALFAATALISASVATAQTTGDNTNAPWRFGVHGGMNFNIVGTGAQTLEQIAGAQFAQGHVNGTTDIIDGTGLGYYAGLLTEFNPGGLFGGHLRVGLDDRRTSFNDWDVAAPANNTRFTARMTYVSVEPMLRLNLVSPNFHMLVGPLLSFKVASKFDYTPGRDETTPAITNQEISGANSFTYGVGGGFGYDILLNSKSEGRTRWYLTPFVEASYMMDQRENTLQGTTADRNDTWVTTSVRGGFQIKFGNAPTPATVVAVAEDVPVIDMSLTAPSAISDERSVTEWFPLRNYIFFDQNSSNIPMKYTRLNTVDAQTFDERTLMNPIVTGTVSGANRSQRQMSVYYQALNVYGDRLRDNPTASITLVGSAPTQSEGLAMANTVRDYLVSTFGLDANRISTRGQTRPPHASGDQDTPKEDLVLVAEENRRVEVLSDNLEILKPVQLNSVVAEPIDNDLALSIRSSSPVDSWTVTVAGEGTTQTYGPYRGTAQRIDAKPILGSRQTGTYTATVTATTTNGQTITRSTNFSLVRREAPPVTGQRHSVLFEFDDSRTVQTYEQFLRQTVAPQIPNGATVVVHGHTDRVGLEDYNLELSSRRAAEARKVLEDELSKQGKKATFDSYGFGETETRAPFTNEAPEGRYYNRTVMIEIIPNS